MPVHTAIADGLATLTLDRPKVNALDAALLDDLTRALAAAAADDAVAGLLVRSNGPAFSAGLDLKSLPGLDATALESLLDALDAGLEALLDCPKPIAAAVEGHAIAGGLVLALAADHLALGTGDYQLGLTEVAVGVPFPPLPFEICRHRLSPRGLARLALGARTVGPAEAFELGAGDVLTDDPVAAATDWLGRVGAYPAATFAATKRQFLAPIREACRRADPDWRERFLEIVTSPAVGRALAAALAK